jgi:hypothetical protein
LPITVKDEVVPGHHEVLFWLKDTALIFVGQFSPSTPVDSNLLRVCLKHDLNKGCLTRKKISNIHYLKNHILLFEFHPLDAGINSGSGKDKNKGEYKPDMQLREKEYFFLIFWAGTKFSDKVLVSLTSSVEKRL